MYPLVFDRFSGGLRKALTLSHDDGQVHDRRLVEIMNRHGLRGTFHLNSGFLGREGYLAPAEIRSLFQGHEVSVHGVSHPHLPHLPVEGIIAEILEDRRALESLVGYTVRGMSYPGGGYDDRVVALLGKLGIEYARTVANQESFDPPSDFLRWPASCHMHNALEQAERFAAIAPQWGTQIFYVWGHSYEYVREGGWDMVETFGRRMGGRETIWYATNMEIVDYFAAVGRMKCSVDGKMAHNPSAVSVWASVGDKAVEIKPGQSVNL